MSDEKFLYPRDFGRSWAIANSVPNDLIQNAVDEPESKRAQAFRAIPSCHERSELDVSGIVTGSLCLLWRIKLESQVLVQYAAKCDVASDILRLVHFLE